MPASQDDRAGGGGGAPMTELNKGQSRPMLLAGLALFVVAVAAVLIGSLLSGDRRHPLRDDLAAFAAIVGVIFGLLLVFMVWAARRDPWASLPPDLGSDPERRLRIVRAVRSGRHLDDADEDELAVQFATYQIRQSRTQMRLNALILLNALLQVLTRNFVFAGLWLALAAFGIGAAALAGRRARHYITT